MHPNTADAPPGRLLRLRGYQSEALDAIDKALTEHTRVAAVIPTGGGKGHPTDTDVPTPDGLRKWGDLKVGDYVFGSNGRPTRVTAIYDRGVLPIYTVALKHGESVQVDGDHLWQVQRKGRKPQVMTTRDLASVRKMKDRDGYCWAIPVTQPVHHRTADLPLHPYVVGALIANGGMTHTGTQLSTPDTDVALRIAEHTAIQSIADTTPGACPRFSLPGLMEPTRQLGLRVKSVDKRIPREYLEADIVQRIDLLHGLMDGDGSSRTGGRRSVAYHTISLGLTFDVKELVTSLGGTCTIAQKDREHEGKSTEYVCRILMPSDIPAFGTGRRDQEEKPRRTFEPRSVITSIFRSGEAPIRCITVEAEDSLYLITRNHIVTHNTVIFAHLIERAHRGGRKALVMVHREELAEQAKAKIHSVAPHLTVGIVKAERNEIDADVIVASVQTLAVPARREQVEGIGIVIVDECHHAVARTWMEVLAHFGCFASPGDADETGLLGLDRYTPAVGFTATLDRTDGKGLGDVWETVCFERDILYMIDNGYLTDVRGTAVTVDGLDLATVAKSRGDYQEGQLGEAMMASGAAEVVAEAYLEQAFSYDPATPGRPPVKQGVLFAPTVASAYDFAEGLNAVGIRTECITGTMDKETRAGIYARYEAGETRVLSNVMVLTEGWDAPWAEVAVIARPTQSPALYTQMVGRVLRPWPNKGTALVLDVVGAAGQHKLQSLTNLVKTEVNDGESYAEARVRLAREMEQGRKVGKTKLSGVLAAQQVELFANSHSTWLQTKGGHWFIPTTFGVFFLWPALAGDTPGTWRLGYRAQKRGGPREQGWIETNLTLEYAMAWGEQMAELDDPTVSLRDRAWRRTKASQGQIDLAIRMKMAPAEHVLDLRKGPLSDLISIHLASKLLDV